jgi:hypothetical protein
MDAVVSKSGLTTNKRLSLHESVGTTPIDKPSPHTHSGDFDATSTRFQ